MPIRQKFEEPPLISQIQAVDLDNDGLMDVILCDCRGNFVSWIRQNPAGTFTESILASDLIAPAHIQVLDFDGDGDKDLLVAVLGMLFPNNDKIGSVVILENDGQFNFRKHVIVEKIARVSDVRGGDLDNDGDLDLAVGQFGYDDGETWWMENLGDWKFLSHHLQYLSGPVNIIITDIDFDKDLDIISLVTQEWKEISLLLMMGRDNSSPTCCGDQVTRIMVQVEFTCMILIRMVMPLIIYHRRVARGIQWLENKGNLNFEFYRICNFTGTTNVWLIN